MKQKMSHTDILHRCFRCGYCKMPSDYADINCPSYLKYRFETYSPGGRMWLLRGLLTQAIEPSWRLAEILFSCASCGNCASHCAFPNFRDELLDAFAEGREKLLDAGIAPKAVRDCLSRWQSHGNAYGLAPKKRALWAAEAGVPAYSDQEYFLWPGDVGSFDTRGILAAKAAAKVLTLAGVDFGTGDGSECADGNEARAMGETCLFDELARKNIGVLAGLGVRKIITLSPHAFNAFKNLYPSKGAVCQVFHYTQVLAFRMGKLQFDTSAPKIPACFHDPCYLGRHNGDYQSARSVLARIPGVAMAEIDRNRQNALCCGGGGGNVFSDLLSGGPDAPARVRVREAADCGAEVLVTACPACTVMLDDAVKAEGLDSRLRVLEMGELILESINGGDSHIAPTKKRE